MNKRFSKALVAQTLANSYNKHNTQANKFFDWWQDAKESNNTESAEVFCDGFYEEKALAGGVLEIAKSLGFKLEYDGEGEYKFI